LGFVALLPEPWAGVSICYDRPLDIPAAIMGMVRICARRDNGTHLWNLLASQPIQKIMKNEPNKAVEPTPVSVTISAAQKVAPLTSVAHL
jgi:hypothetical protein